MKNKILTSRFAPLVALALNLIMAYVVYFIARVAYLLENYSIFSQGLDTNGLFSAFQGGLMFDSSAIMYTCSLYIAMMILPLHLKERHAYNKVCKWIFVIVNAIGLVLNLMDTVYFQYTSRRTTSTVFSEFGNEGNLAGIFGTELLHHWYLVLLAIVVVWLMWKLYVMPRLTVQHARSWRYYVIMVAGVLLMVPAMIGGMRGGLAIAVRPITVSNAN